MIKNALAALAVLSLIPSVAVAVQANLSKAPTSTLTYTVRAKDTAPTSILSMGGASSCSVTAGLASGSVSVVPRADASVAHSTGTAGTVTLSASGSGTLTTDAGQFSVSFTAVGSSMVTITCVPGGGSGGLTSEDLVSYLISGEDGVAVAADPNGTVTCAAGANQCLFAGSDNTLWLSSGTTSWVATGAAGGSADQVLMVSTTGRSLANGAAETQCFQETADLRDRTVRNALVCTDTATDFGYQNGVTITEITAFVPASEDNVEDAGRALNGGCGTCITTDGTNCVAGTEVYVPSANATDQYISGSSSTLSLNHVVAPGDTIGFMAIQGIFNFDGVGTVTCQFGQGDLSIVISGTFP